MYNYIQILQSNPELFKQFSCKELLFLNYDCPVTEKKATKWSEHNYIYYVLTGQKVLHTPHRDKSWLLAKGSASFIKRGACVIEQFFYEPFCILVFIMPDSFISRFIASNREKLPPPQPHIKTNDLILPINLDEMLHNFYISVLPYFSSPIPPSESLIELKFTELLIHIVNNPNNGELISYMHEVAANKTGTLEQVMEANYPFKLELSDYARLCNRSISTFKRDFQSHYKTTPGRWLLEKRLERDNQLLMTTDKDMADVMLESGFENQAHFSKVFKARYGHSPLQYRKQLAASIT